MKKISYCLLSVFVSIFSNDPHKHRISDDFYPGYTALMARISPSFNDEADERVTDFILDDISSIDSEGSAFKNASIDQQSQRKSEQKKINCWRSITTRIRVLANYFRIRFFID